MQWFKWIACGVTLILVMASNPAGARDLRHPVGLMPYGVQCVPVFIGGVPQMVCGVAPTLREGRLSGGQSYRHRGDHYARRREALH
jgi:hypothetical protein